MNAAQDTCLADYELLVVFEDTSLPFSEWTHRAHLRVAYIYLNMYPFAEAVNRIRRGIQRYNLAHNVLTTRTRGYHETITVAFMTLVAAARTPIGETQDSLAFLGMNPKLLNKRVLDSYYSKELLTSALARRFFMSPDRRPLPTVPVSCRPTTADDGFGQFIEE